MPEPAGFSTAVPMTGHAALGTVTLLVAKIEKLKPGAFVNANWTAAEAPAPTIWVEPAVMVSGKIGPVETDWFVALKLKLSMAIPCAPPRLLVMVQTSHKAEPGVQLVMDRPVTAFLT